MAILQSIGRKTSTLESTVYLTHSSSPARKSKHFRAIIQRIIAHYRLQPPHCTILSHNLSYSNTLSTQNGIISRPIAQLNTFEDSVIAEEHLRIFMERARI